MLTNREVKEDIHAAITEEGHKATPTLRAQVWHNYMHNGCHDTDLRDAIITTFDLDPD